MISVSGLEMSHGARTLFRDVAFRLDPGQRHGLVGANGSGKTTLLEILSGELQPTDGSVSLPRKLDLGVLRQDQFLHEDEEILGVTMMGNPELWAAMVAKERMIEGPDDRFDAHRFAELEETVQRHDGYAAEARAAEILEGLGLPAELHRRPVSSLSGGFKLRVLLAQVLAGSPDALLLDEPTNHLDILSIRWLEKFLRGFAGPIVVISHDHRFLDNICTHILDIDYETVTLYRGNYSAFQEAKREERERREVEIANRDREIAHHREFVDRFRAKASKARQAQSKLRLIEKKAESLDPLPPSSRRYPSFRFEQRRPSGRQVLTARGVEKSYGEKEVLGGVDLEVRRGDRVAIMGPNGIGKSTLLKILVGEVEADAGFVTWGHETHPGYFAQDHREQLDRPEWTVEAWLTAHCPGKTIGYVRGELGRVLFSGDEVEKPLAALSGGEAARLVFCRLATESPNVLVLDEPTNHLDLESIEALVEGLATFEGTTIFVSHDRWFVSRLATRIVEILPDGIRDFHGTYEAYVHHCGDDHLDVDTVVLRAKDEKRERTATQGKGGRPEEAQRKGPRADARALRQRRDRVMARIEEAEARVGEIDALFCEPDFYERTPPDRVRPLEAERGALGAEIRELVSEWERIEEELASAE